MLLGWGRLAWGTAFAGAGLLSVVPAPTGDLWKLGLGVTEWGHVFAALALVPLLPGWRRTRPGQVGALLGLAGAGLALWPLAQAVPVAAAVPGELNAAWGVVRPRSSTGPNPIPARASALSLLDVLTSGVPQPAVRMDTLVYGQPGGEALSLDLYRGIGDTRRNPCIVTIHGGSWQNGSRVDLPELNRYLAAQGYTVAAVDYRMAPRWRFPAAVDDIQAAVAYLKANADTLGIDPDQFVLLGRSAGGHLALVAGYAPLDPAIKGVVSLYGPTDLAYGYDHPANPAVSDSRAVQEAFLGGNPTTAAAAYTAASPVNLVGPATPPTLLIHGGRDDLVHAVQSERLAARLHAASRPYYYLRLPWANHACDVNLSGPCGQIVTYTVERFLATVVQ
jgi:acetyl esterase/lipase